jgi:fumarate hydratase class II
MWGISAVARAADRSTQSAHMSSFASMPATVLADKCVKGIQANREMCAYWVERSAALATALAPQIGYAKAAEISKRSVKEGVLIRELVKREKVLPDSAIDDVLDLKKMTEIGVPGGAHAVGGAG